MEPATLPPVCQLMDDRIERIERLVDLQSQTQQQVVTTLAEVRVAMQGQAQSISRLWKFGMWAAGVTTTFLSGLLIALILGVIR